MQLPQSTHNDSVPAKVAHPPADVLGFTVSGDGLLGQERGRHLRMLDMAPGRRGRVRPGCTEFTRTPNVAELVGGHPHELIDRGLPRVAYAARNACQKTAAVDEMATN